MMFERSPDDPLPLVYACSGCSNVAQLANDLALRLDRARLAEMSCIAGVGGDVRCWSAGPAPGDRSWPSTVARCIA